VPQLGHFGNALPYSLVGPGLNVQSVTLPKNFRKHERFQTTFMATAQNVGNHPEFANPSASISSPGTVGIVTSTKGYLDARTIELRLYVQF
jgi:hypothetical protein